MSGADPPPIVSGTIGRGSPSLAAFATLWAAYFATVGLFNPYAPLWFQSLGLGTLAIGALASLQSWTRLLAPYGWSWLADHGGQRVLLIRVAAAGALAATLALALLPLAGPLLGLGLVLAVLVPAVVALLFVFNGGVVPLAEAALSQLLSTGQGVDTARYGRVRLWGSLGFVAAVMGGGLLLEPLGIASLPWLLLVLNAGLLGVALRLPAGRRSHDPGQPMPPVLPILRQPAVAWFFASVFFTVLAHSSLYAFFSLFLAAQGHGKAAVGLLWSVSVVVEVLWFLLHGRWSSRLSAHGWLALAAGVTALRFGALAAGGAHTAVVVATQLAHAITFAAHHAACIDLLGKHFPGRLRGRGQALYTALGYGLSGLLGGVGGGWLIERGGFAVLHGVAALAGLLALGCVWRARRAAACSSSAPAHGSGHAGNA